MVRSSWGVAVPDHFLVPEEDWSIQSIHWQDRFLCYRVVSVQENSQQLSMNSPGVVEHYGSEMSEET